MHCDLSIGWLPNKFFALISDRTINHIWSVCRYIFSNSSETFLFLDLARTEACKCQYEILFSNTCTHTHTYEKQRLESRMTFDQFFHWCSSGGRWIRRIRYIPWITMNNNMRSSSFFENHSKALSKFRQWQCSIWCHEKCSLKKIMIIDVHLFTVPTLKNIIGRLS